MKSKIPCVVLVYYNKEIIRETIDFLIQCDLFKIYVIENFSEFTKDEIRPFLLGKLKQGVIFKYVLMHKNVSNNAYEQFFDSALFEDWNSEYLLITDGDIIVKSPNDKWFREQLEILKAQPEVGCCGINLSSENLPVMVPYFNENSDPMYNCINWLPDHYGVSHSHYVEADTGMHLWLTPVSSFKKFLQWRKTNSCRFIDQNLRNFYKENLRRRWVVTKKNYGVHLIWTIYQDITHPYTQLKINRSFNSIWMHYEYSNYTVYTKSKRRVYYDLRAAKAHLKRLFAFLIFFKKRVLYK